MSDESDENKLAREKEMGLAKVRRATIEAAEARRRVMGNAEGDRAYRKHKENKKIKNKELPFCAGTSPFYIALVYFNFRIYPLITPAATSPLYFTHDSIHILICFHGTNPLHNFSYSRPSNP